MHMTSLCVRLDPRTNHQLFVASLSDAERQYLEESKGLGNSQKAEVAWLEKRGYAYEELDVRNFSKKVARSSVAAAVGCLPMLTSAAEDL